jgi:hypothetical protein
MKQIKLIKTDIQKSKKTYNTCSRDKKGQMIVIMGIILALSVFMIGSIAAEIANLDVVVSTESTTYLLPEFNNIKENFGIALNYNLADITINTIGIGEVDPEWGIDLRKNESRIDGNINQISAAFNQTRDEYHRLELKYGKLFDASLDRYWYSHRSQILKGAITNKIYYVEATLFLEDGKARVTEKVTYSIVS